MAHSGDDSDDDEDDDDVVELSPCGRWEKRRQEVRFISKGITCQTLFQMYLDDLDKPLSGNYEKQIIADSRILKMNLYCKLFTKK